MEKKDLNSQQQDSLGAEEEEEEEEITYYEESSESEPEIDCNTWDDDVRILPQIHIENTTTGCHLLKTPISEPSKCKKLKFRPNIRSELSTDEFKENFRNSWNQGINLNNSSAQMIFSPFKVCVIKNLIECPSFLDELRSELFDINFNLRHMDLYEFFQTKDLKYLRESEPINNVLEFLKEDLMKWVSDLTGFELTDISATCSLYTNTDYLLVHEDLREDRMVAFILYLTGCDWTKEDGGQLQLFSKDETGQPGDIVNSIIPENNQLVFFPVTNDSYHQVSEVTSLNKCRLSINGWFHTKKPPHFETPIYRPSKSGLYSDDYKSPKIVDVDLESWIRDDYLQPSAIKRIHFHIEEYSEIALKSFLKDECFKEISHYLLSEDLKWHKVGPVNRYSYEIVDQSNLPHIIERLLDLFQSKQMFQLLQKYTDLELDNDKARMKFELQRWTPGSFALLTEYDWKDRNELDLILYFGCKNTSHIIGARTHYVTTDDEVQNALMTIEPEDNNLNIVYRDSARFTKYFSTLSKCRCFYMLICSYTE